MRTSLRWKGSSSTVRRWAIHGANPLQPALWFRPQKSLIVRTEVDQAFASRVAAGQKAELFDDNRQASLGSGRIVRLAPWIAQRRTVLDEPFQRNDVRTLECVVALDSSPEGLRIGQRLRVVIDLANPAPAIAINR
ncbi:MAG TPA: hypothetical protein VNC50_05820 [Planctomycetia bacterium]|nr:hypothetical protein [Planctomycetia bacterium]